MNDYLIYTVCHLRATVQKLCIKLLVFKEVLLLNITGNVC